MSKRQTFLGLLAKEGEIEQEQLDEELANEELEHINITFDTNKTKSPEIAFVEVEDNNMEKEYRNRLRGRYIVQRVSINRFSDIFDAITDENLISNGSLDLSELRALQNIKWFDVGNMLLSIAFVNKHNPINKKGGLILPPNLDNDETKRKLSFILPNAFPREQRNENQRVNTIISKRFKKSDDGSDSDDEKQNQRASNPPNRNFSKSAPARNFHQNRQQNEEQSMDQSRQPREMRNERLPEPQNEKQYEKPAESRKSVFSYEPQPAQVAPSNFGTAPVQPPVQTQIYEEGSIELEEDFPPNAFINDFNRTSETNVEATWQYYDENCKFSITAEEDMYVSQYSRNLLYRDINLVIGDPTSDLRGLLDGDEFFSAKSVMTSAITSTIYSVLIYGIAQLVGDGRVNFERVLTLLQVGEGKYDFRIVSDQIHFSK